MTEMLIFTVQRTETSDEGTVQPFHEWSVMLADDSPLQKRTNVHTIV